MPRKRKFKTIREAMQANAAARWSKRTPEQRRAELEPACVESPMNKPGRATSEEEKKWLAKALAARYSDKANN